MPICTAAEKQFAQLVADGVKPVDAYAQAFPEKKESKWLRDYARQLAMEPRIREQIELIQQACRLQFVIEAPSALERMVRLAETADSEKVKLDANKDILDRAGLKPPDRVESVHVGIFGSASAEDIRNLLRQKMIAKVQGQ